MKEYTNDFPRYFKLDRENQPIIRTATAFFVASLLVTALSPLTQSQSQTYYEITSPDIIYSEKDDDAYLLAFNDNTATRIETASLDNEDYPLYSYVKADLEGHEIYIRRYEKFGVAPLLKVIGITGLISSPAIAINKIRNKKKPRNF